MFVSQQSIAKFFHHLQQSTYSSHWEPHLQCQCNTLQPLLAKVSQCLCLNNHLQRFYIILIKLKNNNRRIFRNNPADDSSNHTLICRGNSTSWNCFWRKMRFLISEKIHARKELLLMGPTHVRVDLLPSLESNRIVWCKASSLDIINTQRQKEEAKKEVRVHVSVFLIQSISVAISCSHHSAVGVPEICLTLRCWIYYHKTKTSMDKNYVAIFCFSFLI